MATKKFGDGIHSILMSAKSNTLPLPQKKENLTKSSTIVVLQKNLYEKAKALAYWDRTTLKHVIEHVLNLYFACLDPIQLQNILSKYRASQETSNARAFLRNNIKKFDQPSVRINLVIEKDLLEKAKALAYWDRMTLRSFIEEVMSAYFTNINQNDLHLALEKYRNSQPNVLP